MRVFISLCSIGIPLAVSGTSLTDRAYEPQHLQTADNPSVRITAFEVRARIVRDTTFFGRRLRVVPEVADGRLPDVFDVLVPMSACVVKHDRRVSVHELRTGDVIIAEGIWGSTSFIATGILANYGPAWDSYDRGRDYRSVQGRVAQVDYPRLRFTLETSSRILTVYADRARVWRAGDIGGFEHIQSGDAVWIRGNVDGNLVDAERIEVSRFVHLISTGG